MQIIQAVPPNIEAILNKFNLAEFTPIFAYGDKLYNPAGLPIPEDLMVHEETHQRQQEQIGVEQWWDMYLEEPKFRLEQEVEAYQAQWQYALKNYNRQGRKRLLQEISKNLSSALYGNIISKKEAEELINV